MRASAEPIPFGKNLTDTLNAASPPLLYALRLWASVCLALYIAFWLQLDNPFWAGTSAAIVCQPQLGASRNLLSPMRLNPTISRQALAFAAPLSAHRPPAAHSPPHRASGFVLTSKPAVCAMSRLREKAVFG